MNSIIELLLDKDILDFKALINLDTCIVSINRRHHNFYIVTGDEDSIFVKIGAEGGTKQSLQNEINTLTKLSDYSFSDSLPVLRAYDIGYPMIVLKYINGTTLSDFLLHTDCEKTLNPIFSDIAIFFRALHSRPTTPGKTTLDFSILDVLKNIIIPSSKSIDWLSQGQKSVTIAAQSSTSLFNAFEYVQFNWKCNSVTHSDFRLENIMIAQPTKPGDKTPVKIVDWEFSMIGDARWDIACLLAGGVYQWISSIPPFNDNAIDEAISSTSSQYRINKTIARALHHDYILPNSLDSNDLIYISYLVSLRLIQYAMESEKQHQKICYGSVLILQVAENIATQPLETWRDIWCIDL